MLPSKPGYHESPAAGHLSRLPFLERDIIKGKSMKIHPQENATQRTMIDERELSARIGVPVGTLQNWRVRRKAGEDIGPPFVKVGASVRYRIADVEAWEAGLAAQNDGATSPPDRRSGFVARPRHQGAPAKRAAGGQEMLSPHQLSKRLGVRLAVLNEWRRRRYKGEEAGPRFVDLGAAPFESIPMYRLCDVEEWESGHRD